MTAGQASVLENAIPALERLEALLVATKTAQTASLHKLLPELQRLERALGEERRAKAATLHALIADERLKRLELLDRKYRHEFDALDFVGQKRYGSGEALWGSEEFHSNVLAWLLNPKEHHGLGDRFLRHFLRGAEVPEAIRSVDWSTADVKREWGHEIDGKRGRLDLLVVNEPQRVLFAIENKTFSGEHDEQLTRYRRALETESPTFSKHFVFLSPQGTEPYLNQEKKHWKPLTYSTIRDILQEIVHSDNHVLNADVRVFLRQYATTLRRNIVPDSSISQLAKRVWIEHREALDLLIDHRPY